MSGPDVSGQRGPTGYRRARTGSSQCLCRLTVIAAKPVARATPTSLQLPVRP